MGNARCQCGGHTFSDLMGGAKVVCRHCGKVYLKSEFDALLTRELTPVEREDRHIFSLLLAGGDLREGKERDLLILKDRSGIPEGDLPLAYGEHFARTYRDAQVVRTTLAAKREERLALAQAQALSL